MKTTVSIVIACLLVGAAGCAQEQLATEQESYGQEIAGSTKIDRAEFASSMQMLWEDHVSYTRMYIVSAAAGLPDIEETADRLMQNQVDIGNALRPFYGDDAANAVTDLLKEHIAQAAELIAAAKAGDKAKVTTVKEAWFKNADAIAEFLANANTNWEVEDLRMHMHDHLNLTLEEATKRLEGDYKADIAAYDKVHAQAVVMAKVLSDGVVEQFTDRFIPSGPYEGP